MEEKPKISKGETEGSDGKAVNRVRKRRKKLKAK